jgi:hypothetical protein
MGPACTTAGALERGNAQPTPSLIRGCRARSDALPLKPGREPLVSDGTYVPDCV